MNKPAPASRAEVLREYGPFDGVDHIHGVTHDGERIWAAASERLLAIDPDSGQVVRALDRPCDAGTAFDGTHLYQIVEARIDKIDPRSGEVVASIPAPGAAPTRVSRGPKAACGSASTATGESTASTRQRVQSSARSNPTVSSPA